MKQIFNLSRAFLALIIVAAILLVSDLNNRNPEKNEIQKFCLIHYIDSPNSEDCEHGLRKGLEDIGLVENKDFTFQVYNAQGDISTLNSIAETVNSSTWDLIFTSSTPTIQVISNKIKNTHIVFTNVGDPVAAGLGKTFQDHMPNITGISTMSDFKGLVDIVAEIQPGIKTVGTVYTPAEVNSVAYMQHLKEAAAEIGIELVTMAANTATEVGESAIALASRNIEAFTQISDNLTASCSAAIIKASKDSGIPYYGFITSQLGHGAVAVAARDYFQAGYDAAMKAKKVLAGEKPINIPYDFVQKTSYQINEKAVEFYKLSVSQELKNRLKLK
ncbi:ABC transporter substrate-binding protein [Bacteroidota bacterium]